MLVLVVLLLAPLITFEAWRFRRWEPGVAALLILLACVAALAGLRLADVDTCRHLRSQARAASSRSPAGA